MTVEVRLFATLRTYGPPDGSPLPLEIAEGGRVRDLLDALHIPADAELVILVNGRPARRETLLVEGDRVVVFPPVAGG